METNEMEMGISAQDFLSRIQSRKELATQIFDYCTKLKYLKEPNNATT
jgi:hypothetical protein